ncbi:MAG: MerR family transcriptional regulator [Oscillospiraceae bacterium]|nr:MerR family transcriptional regulator [Oscillospiraceae bacterium]
MKINEVERLVGVSKKNIRFYEEQGLLTPQRNSENGYRDYGETEVEALRRIRVMRKLGVPIEEIRRMLRGEHTVADGMRRHLITLEREQRNLQQSAELCRELQSSDIPLTQLDAAAILAEMETMERGGAAFQDKQSSDVRVRYIAPVVITVVFVALMAVLGALLLWGFRIDPAGAPPFWFVLVILGILAAIAAGVVLALVQRLKEIVKGEMDDAKHY